MKKFFQKQREIIILLVYGGVIAALVYLVIIPIMSRIDETRNQIQEDVIKQDSYRSKISELPKIQQQYSILESNEDLAGVLLADNEAVTLIESLEKLAADSNNTISITTDESSQKAASAARGKAVADNALIESLPSKEYLKLKITLVGDYNSIVNFVYNLERFEYYSDITGMQIGKDDQVDDSSQQGTSNPFGGSDGKKIEVDADKGPLKASLDVVFYTKKQ